MSIKAFSFQSVIFALSFFLITACGGNDEPQVIEEESGEDMVEVYEEPIEEEEEIIEEEAPAPVVATPAPAPKAKVKEEPQPEGETIYVQSYDHKGKVWGHVTMYGDKGSGVIYDSDENAYEVRCMRNGNELFAVDQNSRRYVFKIE